jgi:hypothetical protein
MEDDVNGTMEDDVNGTMEDDVELIINTRHYIIQSMYRGS